MKIIGSSIFFLLCSSIAFSQANADNLSWSATRKLTVEDFTIKTKDLQASTSYGQYYMDFEVRGFDAFSKNFNKRVHNYLIRSASWIDTTSDVTIALRYQQTLFDICEIYTRQLRKDLKENRKKLLKGTQIVNELNATAMSAFSRRRLAYDSETGSGTIAEKQSQWEEQVQKELAALQEYALQ
jgi:hypothetical protein